MKGFRFLLVCLLTISCRDSGLQDFDLPQVPYPPKIYVANEGSNQVTAIAQNTNRVVGSVPVGEQPVDLAFHPARKELYVLTIDTEERMILSGFRSMRDRVPLPFQRWESVVRLISRDQSRRRIRSCRPANHDYRVGQEPREV